MDYWLIPTSYVFLEKGRKAASDWDVHEERLSVLDIFLVHLNIVKPIDFKFLALFNDGQLGFIDFPLIEWFLYADNWNKWQADILLCGAISVANV